MSDLTKGEVVFTVDGESYTLKPSLKAFSQLSANGADYGGVMLKIMQNNAEEMVRVIKLGLNWGDAESLKAKDLVFRAGMKALHDPLTDYVFRLFNGGKSAKEVAAEAQEEASRPSDAA